MPDHKDGLAQHVVAWHRVNGRHDLPWTISRTPYTVWLSEIMLQQTQVATVIPYFNTFLARYTTVEELADASQDEVLHLWSGLGYYSRARNLHRTAKIVSSDFAGEFPCELEALMALPGIGRSTAGAILSLAFDQRAAILDGNVKRVLARYHAVGGWPGDSKVMKQLWSLAESHLPELDCRSYTQAMMDLGATLCTRRKPACERCPLAARCVAYREQEPESFPGTKPRAKLPTRNRIFLIIDNADGHVLLERRPPQGIWGGLWSFPELADGDDLPATLAALGITDYELGELLPSMQHTFTHFRLLISPRRVTCHKQACQMRESDALVWYEPGGSRRLGLSKPVTQLLKNLRARPR